MAKKQNKKLPFINNGIAQIAIVVKNLDEAVKQYWEKIGVGPWQFYIYGKPLLKKITYHGKPADYCMRLALTNISSIRIELIQPVAGENVISDFVKQHGNEYTILACW